jgi:hypothetical protein
LRAETERSGGVDSFDREAEARGLEDCGEAAEGGIAWNSSAMDSSWDRSFISRLSFANPASARRRDVIVYKRIP